MSSSELTVEAAQLACLKAVVGDTMPELIWNTNDENDEENGGDDELLDFVTTEIWNADVLQSLPLEQTEEMTSKQRRTLLQNSSSRLALAVSQNLRSLGCTVDDEESLAVCTNVIKEWWKQVEVHDEEETAKGGQDEDEEADNDDDDEDVPPGHCVMCLRYMPLTFHHLCPRMLHKGMLKKGMYTKQNINDGIDICRPCHSAIHKLFDHETMALKVNTLEKILEDERVQRWVRYAEKQRVVSKDHTIRGLRYRR
ncbi:hypothetical protein MPTK1_8g16410 [Marchantia polymorpha subsp. ruderalis]|uniref:HNH domain-containing protein n=2 Tax=Marchantia polymorpha TaxID=3197 RepID=A0A2R6W4K7_MARPO|nr:hypothetical protein MARPO_0154s0023 [Marchantia polymorpha]BBN20096.1 hypothetical protein Mp_8g16410 [Marchantia polymorpha subsp. ruderalis]|eukprot:PTQ28797.1 hypothetical protein MARPO_0154s0023 [Marchantia polymorpha]